MEVLLTTLRRSQCHNLPLFILLYHTQFDYFNDFNNTMSKCVFTKNSVLNSLIYMSINGSDVVQVTVKDSTFTHNVGNVFYIQTQVLQLFNENSTTDFDDN